MTPVLAFDIETVPDARAIRLLYELPDSVDDGEAVEYAQQQRRAQTGSDFLQLHLHRVVAVSCCLRWENKIHIGTIGTPQDDERTVISEFFRLIEKRTPQLVSWNGGGFDLPVLHYRALMHGIAAARYWDTGEGDFADSRDFKWNNYINRYHSRHCDLMDVLAMYQARANVPLDDMAKLCGFPGKLGMDGSRVWAAFQNGEIDAIRDYCETDAANTYLVYLRFCLMNGRFSAAEYENEIYRFRNYIVTLAADKAHWREFAEAWG